MKTLTTVSLLAATWTGGAVLLMPSKSVAQAGTTPNSLSAQTLVPSAPTTKGPASAAKNPSPGSKPVSSTGSAPAQPTTNATEEVIVTAQKRQERVQSVGMSIQTFSGDTLNRLGITDTTQLTKVVPGFTYSYGFDGSPVYSIRGVGFQDTSLAGSPTVSVYNDEVPLPFNATTLGSTVDLQRVEILKGPQGTLFGENATGGAINYIANKPTDHFEAGEDTSFGSFNTLDTQGYISGPVTNNLDVRLALRTTQGSGWQYSTTRDATLGVRNFTTGRLSALWTPTENLRILATLSGFYDKGDSQAGQFYGIKTLEANPIAAGLRNYPLAPRNDQAADWGACVNNTPLLTGCTGYSKSNSFFSGNVRVDYDLPHAMTVTSLTSYQKYQQYFPFDDDGTTYRDYEALSTGHLDTVYQELRLHGQFAGKGDWIFGGNYEHDGTWQNVFSTISDSSAATEFGINTIGNQSVGGQTTNTYAAFSHAEYPILDNLTANAGIRFTQADESFIGGNEDNGNGRTGLATSLLASYLQTGNPFSGTGLNTGPSGPVTLGPGFVPEYFHGSLNENNVSWRVGLDWKPAPRALIYGNVSKGFKSGSFPVISATRADQLTPAKQESLLGFEAGFKTEVVRNLQFDGAAFYYHYYDKQIDGSIEDPILGALPKLVNVPHSHVAGFELSGIWTPLAGLIITPTLSYAQTHIDGNYLAYNYLGVLQNVGGERYPGTPEWQADIDAQYNYRISQRLTAFIGANVSYQGAQNSGFGDFAIVNNQAYTLLDLRAGVDTKAWRFQIWGRNVTNQYYTYASEHIVDTYIHITGMPSTVGAEFSYKF